jgi:hypothetical protein
MPRSTLLLITPLFAASYLAPLVIASCTETPLLPAEDPYGWNDDSSVVSSATVGASSGAPSSGSTGGSGVGGGDPSSGSSGGSTPSSGGSGTQGSSGPGSPTGSSGGTDGGDAYVGYCGSGNCDYHTSTCCLPGDAGGLDAAYCVKGLNYACGANVATYHCLGQIDCPTSGKVCCGVYDTTAMTAGTACQTGPCQNPQFCLGDPECAGPKCTKQACQGVSPLYLCGLQSGPPYMCTAAP